MLTTGVNKAQFFKNIEQMGDAADLWGKLFEDRAHIYETRDKWCLLSVWMLYNCTSGVPTSMRASDPENCNLEFTGFAEFI